MLLMIPVIIFLAQSRQASLKYASIVKKIEARDEPINCAQLNAMYEAPTDEVDATPIYLEALQPLSGKEFAEASIDVDLGTSPPLPGKPWPKQAAAKTLLNDYRPTIEKLHEARRLGGRARYPVDLKKGLQAELDYMPNMRSAMRLLQIQAYQHAHNGNAQGVTDCIKSGFAAARSGEDLPIIIAHLSALAGRMLMLDSLEELIPYVPFTDGQLAEIQKAVRQIDVRRNLCRALQGERAVGLDIFENLERLNPNGTNGQVTSGTRLFLQSKDRLMYARLLTDSVEAVKIGWPEALAAGKRNDKELTALQNESNFQKLPYMVTLMLAPALSRISESGMNAEANSRATDALIAVRRFELANGKAPQNLAQLVPKFLPKPTLDPANGKPLRYINDAQRIAVYSVGIDQTDDGGKEIDLYQPDVVAHYRLDGTRRVSEPK